MSHRSGPSGSGGNAPKMYSVFLGDVASVQPYGVFVKIPFCKKNGLVHKSQMSSTKVEDPEDMCSVGDRVWCKVISMEGDGEKIGLCMKVVNQTTGHDDDPNHVQASMDEQRRKTGFKRDIPRIELGAVLDTTCKKCGGKGHLAKDCFHIPGSKTYELLPDDVDMYVGQEQEQEQRSNKKKDKKRKKKHKKGAESDCDDDSPKKKKKKAKKHKKKHKRKEASGESESDPESEKETPRKQLSESKKRKRSESESPDSSSEADQRKDNGRHGRQERHRSDSRRLSESSHRIEDRRTHSRDSPGRDSIRARDSHQKIDNPSGRRESYDGGKGMGQHGERRDRGKDRSSGEYETKSRRDSRDDSRRDARPVGKDGDRQKKRRGSSSDSDLSQGDRSGTVRKPEQYGTEETRMRRYSREEETRHERKPGPRMNRH